MQIEPVTLTGTAVRLEPLTAGHLPALWEVAQDAELWRYTVSRVETRDDLARYVDRALTEQTAGRALPFVTVHRASDTVVGSTRFANISVPDLRAEIGWTWITRPYQRTAVNTEAKLLMLEHAFERWQLRRVEIKTGTENRQSREAIRRLGAVEEGVLRQYLRKDDGTWRDSVFFSILSDEWPAVRERLAARLAAHG